MIQELEDKLTISLWKKILKTSPNEETSIKDLGNEHDE